MTTKQLTTQQSPGGMKTEITQLTSGATRYFLELPCQPAYLRSVREVTNQICDHLHLEMKDRFQLELVIDEACMNAIDHGSAIRPDMNFQVSYILEKGRLIILIKDFGGKPFNPDYFERLAEKKTWGNGGRGIHIIKQLMDEVMYFFSNGRSTTLTMVKYLPTKKIRSSENSP